MIFNKPSLLIRLESDMRVIKTLETGDNCEPITIGRSSESTWKVDDPLVEPIHARILMKRDKLILENLGKSGIYLLEKKIDRAVMRPGLVYRIGRGSTKLSIEKIVRTAPKHAQEQYHRLEQLTGENKGKIYPIRKKEGDDFLVVGSGDHADIMIPESWISREHALLEVTDEGCFIFDGNKAGKPSRNGTKVEQEPVSVRQGNLPGRQLQDGQIVSMAHVDLRFWDKNVVHVRSHIFLRLGIVLMTIAIVLSVRLIWQSSGKGGPDIRREAQQLAAEGRFDEALAKLDESTTARGADDDYYQRTEFRRKLNIWIETSTQWNSIRGKLLQEKGQNWREINSMFAPLISSSNETWGWNNSSAIKEKKTAQCAHALIDAMLAGNDFIRTSNRDFNYLERLQNNIISARAAAMDAPEQFPALMAASERTEKELVHIRHDYEAAAKAMETFDSAEKAMSVYHAIQGIRAQNVEHNAERSGQNLSVSTAVIQYCDDMLIPLELLDKTQTLLQKNYEAIARLNLEGFSDALTLPTAQQFMVAKKLADRCTEMQQICERQKRIVRQMTYFQSRFKEIGFAKDKTPEDLRKLFDEENIEKVLACDCLESKMPGSQEKEPTSVYDSILGVQAFYEYLRSLDGTFDTSVFIERFRPVLFRSSEVFDLLNSFLDFTYSRNDSSLVEDMSVIRNIQSGNELMALVENAENIRSKNKSLMRRLLQISLTQEDRKGIIAGGMVCWLMGSTQDASFVPEDFRESVFERQRKLHRDIGTMQNKVVDGTPEERKAMEKTILTLGIPGDSMLRQPWSDLFSGK